MTLTNALDHALWSVLRLGLVGEDPHGDTSRGGQASCVARTGSIGQRYIPSDRPPGFGETLKSECSGRSAQRN
jgi:hypothetical protein